MGEQRQGIDAPFAKKSSSGRGLAATRSYTATMQAHGPRVGGRHGRTSNSSVGRATSANRQDRVAANRLRPQAATSQRSQARIWATTIVPVDTRHFPKQPDCPPASQVERVGPSPSATGTFTSGHRLIKGGVSDAVRSKERSPAHALDAYEVPLAPAQARLSLPHSCCRTVHRPGGTFDNSPAISLLGRMAVRSRSGVP